MNTELKKLIEYPTSGILSKAVDKNDKVEISLFCMAKGTDLSEHTSTREGLVVVLDGNGEFILEGKRIKMTPGVFIHMSSNAVHALKATENTAFLLILFN
jgi:nitric oxide dioxygenase